MKYTLLQSALRELHAVFSAPVRLVAMAIAIALLTLSGPFGTASYGDATRLIYWAIVVVLTYSSGQVSGALAYRALLPRGMAVPVLVSLVALIASIPAGLVVIVATWIAEPSTMPHPLLLWFYAFAVCMALVVMSTMIERGSAMPKPDANPNAAPAILDRLPLPQRGRLLHLAVADHYVEVITDKGKALLLLRLSDAIRETAPVPGLQVHRSHWVALDAVRKATRQSGKPVLELNDGSVIPISRSYLPAAKAAGLVS